MKTFDQASGNIPLFLLYIFLTTTSSSLIVNVYQTLGWQIDMLINRSFDLFVTVVRNFL